MECKTLLMELLHGKQIKKTMLDKCSLLLLYYYLLLGYAVSTFTPITYPAQIVSSQCSKHNQLFDEQLVEALHQIQISEHFPEYNTSCLDIHSSYPSAPSGYYNITTNNCSAVEVHYCDMEGTNCGGEGGWTRVAYTNMTQANSNCPGKLEQMSFSGSSYCGRFSHGSGCASAFLNYTTIKYRQVCGRVAGYQVEAPDTFTLNSAGIDEVFVDGVSITYGTPRKHIWTYAAGFTDSNNNPLDCPCNNGSTNKVPSYVGSDYYCESGNYDPTCRLNMLYSNDVLWDRQQCGGMETPCCTYPNMPWFVKTLDENTTDTIELRACQRNFGCAGAVAVFLIEVYVQ